MARPKTKSKLVDGMEELVGSLRNIESQLNLLLKSQKKSSGKTGRRGRPPGSGKKKGPGRPAGSGRGPGRPPGSVKKGKPGRPAGKGKKGKPGRPRKNS